MRSIFTILLSFIFVGTSLFGQNEYAKVIHEFAEINVEAIKENEMDKRLALVHPNLIAMGGGMDSYKSILESELKVYEDQKIKIVSAEFGEPGEIVKAGLELHCLMTQKLVVTVNGAEAEQTTNLLAASLDDGETWKFVDLNHHDAASIKVFFPYYSDELMSVFEN